MGEEGDGARASTDGRISVVCTPVDLGPHRVWVALGRLEGLDPRGLARLSGALEREGIMLLGLPGSVSPCRIAQSVVYAYEDFARGAARARRLAIEALLYLTGASQISEALEIVGDSPHMIAVATLDLEACKSSSRKIFGQDSIVREPAPCSAQELEELSLLHIEIA
jgi:hypothetical protein